VAWVMARARKAARVAAPPAPINRPNDVST
jgi:hypothetical protein